MSCLAAYITDDEIKIGHVLFGTINNEFNSLLKELLTLDFHQLTLKFRIVITKQHTIYYYQNKSVSKNCFIFNMKCNEVFQEFRLEKNVLYCQCVCFFLRLARVSLSACGCEVDWFWALMDCRAWTRFRRLLSSLSHAWTSADALSLSQHNTSIMTSTPCLTTICINKYIHIWDHHTKLVILIYQTHKIIIIFINMNELI